MSGELTCNAQCQISTAECLTAVKCTNAVLCIIDCEQNSECVAKCAPPKANHKQAFDTLWRCLERNFCMDVNCAMEKYAAQSEDCLEAE